MIPRIPLSPLYTLAREQWVPGGLDEIFRFFEDPRNLGELTPPWLAFEIRAMSTPSVQTGTIITYRVRWMGLPMEWITLIERWEPPRCFVDTALKSPYAFWHHEHTFEPASGGVILRDRVSYRMPFGPIGSLARLLIVRRQLEGIFDYRASVIARRFSGGTIHRAPPASAASAAASNSSDEV